jgi:uncharacterized protein
MDIMTTDPHSLPDPDVSCKNCAACCCRQEAMLFGDSHLPAALLVANAQGGLSMARLEDGWCAALDRTSMSCTIYAKRPWICREFEMGGAECLEARSEDLPGTSCIDPPLG